jgi:alpha-glucosidase
MVSQEFYRWDSVASSARNAIKLRYSLLDYFYTHMRRQSLTGEPALKPLWFAYPKDAATFTIDKQFFFGDSIVSLIPHSEEK